MLGENLTKAEITMGTQYTDTSELNQRVRVESGLIEERKTNSSHYSEGKDKLNNNDRDVNSAVDTVLTNHENPLITENTNPLPINEHTNMGVEPFKDQNTNTNKQPDESEEAIEIGNTSSESGNQLKIEVGSSGQSSRNISPRKLEVVGSDDELEPIFQGRINSSDQQVKEQSNKDLTEDLTEDLTDDLSEEEVRAKEAKGMCDHINDERDRVRCKVIACFRDNQYCF